ncbi:MAG: hypothetical protein ACSW8H_07535 [bacterium]
MGVMMNFSFLLGEKRFIPVLPRKKQANTKQTIFVVPALIKNGSIPPAANNIYRANICTAS